MSNIFVKIVPEEEGVKIALASLTNGDRYSITTIKETKDKKNVITNVKAGKYKIEYPESYFGTNTITIKDEQAYSLTVVHRISCSYEMDYKDLNNIKVTSTTLHTSKPFDSNE